MVEITWVFLIISIIILFGINTGLGLGLSKLSEKKSFIVSMIFCLLIFLSIILINDYGSVFYNTVNKFISEILGFISILTILSGIMTIKNWKKEKKSDYTSSIGLISSLICCFFGVVSASILLTSSKILNIESNILLTITLLIIIIVSHTISKLLKKAETPFPIILGNFMILNGFYFVIGATFIPNLNTLSSVNMNPLYINWSISIFFLLIAGIGVFLVGVFLQNRISDNKSKLWQLLINKSVYNLYNIIIWI